MSAFIPSTAAFAAADDQLDYTRAPDERLAWAIHVALLEFFPQDTAFRAELQDPADRFCVAYPARSQGLYVHPGTFKVVDDVRNCVYTVKRADFTPNGIDIGRIIYGFLGLANAQLDERVQLCTKPTPWFDSGRPIRCALSYVQGCWVPVDNYLHAWDLGYPRDQRFIIQTDAVDLWVRDLATNLVYETTAAELAPGILIRDLVKKPELLHKPGALYMRYDASREWEPGEDWVSYRAPNHYVELELTAHRYWVWQNEFDKSRTERDAVPSSSPGPEVDSAVLNLDLDMDEAMDAAPETVVSSDDESPSVPASPMAESDAGSAPDSLPDLLPVSDSSSSSSSDSVRSSPEPESDSEGEIVSLTWEEYGRGAHGAGWYRHQVRFAGYDSDDRDEYYDYESGDARSA